jgi:nucleotide-binding universal stress UspA family protein
MFKKILACLDGSKLAEQILPYAGEQALRFESQLVLLHVLAPTDLPPAAGIGVGELMRKQAQAEAKFKAYLEQLAERLLREYNLRVESAVERGTVGETVINYATRNSVELIVIATHGEGGLKRLLFGSVVDSVLRNSDIPVLVIRPAA